MDELAMIIDGFDLAIEELPEPVRAWLDAQSAVVVLLERTGDEQVHIRRIPDLDLALLARIGVTMAKYREALTNLT